MEKPYVFISYSTKDQEKASRVHDFLTENGINAWIASKDIHGGEDFANEITNAVNGCDCFVFVMSQNSDDSPHCINELSLAFSGRKKIIPLKIQEFTLSKTSTYFLQRAQWVNAVDNFELGLKEMLNQMGKEASEETFLDQEKIQFEKQEKNLIKRAYLFLEEGKFAEADKYAEKVLDLDMEYAEAYLIKTLVDFRLSKLEQLFTFKTPIESNANLNKALRFASEEYKNVLLSYVDKNKEFLENERKKGIYNLALSRIKKSPNEINYKKSMVDLKSIIDFKDSKEQIIRIEKLLKDWKDREERKRKQKQEILKKQREEELRRKKNKKKILIVSVVVLCLVIIATIIICSINTAKKSEKYELAQEYYIGKNYEQAKELFSQLGDFKDSSLMVKRSTYILKGDYGELVKLDKLTEYTIPNGVKRIEDKMFQNCGSLTSIVIPNSVTSIGSYAFSGCTSLAKIEVDVRNASYKDINGNLYSKDGKTLIQYAIGKTNTSFIIPNNVTSISNSAFEDCTSLTGVYIPNSVTSIGNFAFSGCTSLTSILIPNSVIYMGDYAFSACSSLTIYCEAESKPGGWAWVWNPDNRPVVWGYER
ncbi:MAG: leucine-rich repeat protein [Clostridia bacterium]|nr:leucine-rich repeat protein [Clostridia bacterium]